jgi:hypothetical protein
MKILQQPLKWQVGLILIVGVFAVSTAAIFIRLAMNATASAGVNPVGFSLFLVQRGRNNPPVQAASG